ncbi:MAG: amidohydrolase [Dehalococcoidia bacterium]|nr:amidohydrolase [Dehalococcoidia bacterium]
MTTISGYPLISADSHIFEPADLWTTRLPKAYRSRAPHIEHGPKGDWWYCDGLQITAPYSGTATGMRFTEPEKVTANARIKDARRGGWVPEETIKDMDIDGVDKCMLYPTTGTALMRLPDSVLVSQIAGIYNSWLAEFCSASPKRLLGLAAINTDNIPEAVKELQRCAKLGFVGALIPIRPLPSMPYDLPEYDALWAAAQDLQMPLALHISSQRMGPLPPGVTSISLIGKQRHGTEANDSLARDSLGEMLFSGVFERFPKLRVGPAEAEMGWAPFFISRLDHRYIMRPGMRSRTFKDGMIPSQLFHRNVFFTFLEDPIGVTLRNVMGVDNLMWGNDYPHAESTWPRSRQILDEVLAGCSEEEKIKISGGNATRIYHLN